MAWEKRGILTLKYPVDAGGIITNYDDYEKVLHNAFYNEIRRAPEEHPTLIVEGIRSNNKQKEKITQILMETFNVPLLYLVPKPVLSLIESGRMSGTVVWSGAKSTGVLPIYEGYTIRSCVQETTFGGENVTEDIKTILSKKDNYGSINPDIIDDLKKTTCFVPRDYSIALQSYTSANDKLFYDHKYELSEDVFVTFGPERFQCGESFFTPGVLEASYGITHKHTPFQELFSKCLTSLQTSIPSDFLPSITSSIHVGGGNSCFSGFKARLSTELRKIFTQNKMKDLTLDNQTFVCNPGRGVDYMSASVFCRQVVPYDRWLAKDVYDEYGPSHIHAYCFH